MADEGLQLRYQDVLDSFIGERIAAVRSALYERQWVGIKDGSGDVTKTVEGATYRAHFAVTQVGAGRNVVGYRVEVIDGVDVQAEIGDTLELTPEEVAARIDAVFNSGAAMPEPAPVVPVEPTPEPEPLTTEPHPDVPYLQSIIDGSADLSETAIPARLKQIHADNPDNAEVQALFKEAVKAYSAYAIAKAKAKLAA